MDDGLYFDEDDYGLEYSEESASEPDVDLENQYYLAKTMKKDDPLASLIAFQKVLDLQGDIKGEWGFKTLKQIVKINFQLRNFDETMRRYKELLSYINNAVTKNHGEKSVNSILDYTSNSKNMDMLKEFYEITLDALKVAKNDRLWMKTSIKLGKVYLERGEYGKLMAVLKQLKQIIAQYPADVEDIYSNKGAQLLEIFALELQLHTVQKNHKQLKEVYEKCLHIKSAIPHPLIMSIIRECGGKMYLRMGDYEKAYTDFFEAFKNYDESGNPRRITCLKYLILTSMLTKSVINPFDSQEAKPYINHPEINVVTNLISAFQNNQTKEFERIFQENRGSLMDDQFMHEHIAELLKHVRSKVIVSLIKPYKLIKISSVAEEIGISYEETENLLISCILDGIIQARIDQVEGVLVTEKGEKPEIYLTLAKVCESLDKISLNVIERLGA